LRNISNEIVQVYDAEMDTTLTQVDLIQAKQELYPGAIYLHDTAQFKCVELNLDTKIAHLIPCDLNYFTEPYGQKEFRILNVYEDNKIGRTHKYFGFVNVKNIISGYKMIQFYSHQNLGYESLEVPLSYDMDTEAYWVGIPENVCEVLKTIEEVKEFEVYESIAFSILAATSMKVMAAFSDIGDSFLGENEFGEEGHFFERFIIIFDNYPGGLGFSEKGYVFCEEIIKDAIDLVSNCKCKNGCPSCIGPHEMDKSIVLWTLKNFFEESPPPKVNLVPQKNVETQIEYPYDWDTLEEDWDEIVDYMLERNLEGAKFLSSVNRISKEDAKLILYFQETARKLFDSENIKQRIMNNFSMIIDLPKDFLLVFAGVDEKDLLRKREQLSRHLSNDEH
jgi:DEAD/DEAH box helicase domain-containing protein